MKNGITALVISDTHLKTPDKLLELLSGMAHPFDVVIHAGDFCSWAVLDALQSQFNLWGVWGNNDPPEIREVLPESCSIDLGGFHLGVTHGHGEGRKDTQTRAYEKVKERRPDVIIFGHSHQPSITTKNGILLLNPGSLFYKRRERWTSFLLVHLNFPSVKAELIFIPKIHDHPS